MSPSGDKKTQFWANFNIWGLLYSALLPIRAKFRVLEQTTVYAYVPNLVSIGLFYRPLAAKPPNFDTFWFGIFWCCQLAAVWESWTRVLNYKPSPIRRHQNCFYTPTASWRNRKQKLRRSKAWRTHRQTNKKLNIFGRPWPHQSGTAIEDLEHVLASRKLLGIRCTVSPGNPSLKLKPP